MARYIDADKVMEEINRIGGHNLCEWETIGVKALIDRQPTADVVEVVRCKDCKYRGDFSCPMCYEEHIDYDDDGYFESDYILHDRTTDNGFCDYGEKALKEREKE